jgi:23S rRNA (pseudouridine1915-N3)-methyltransferase
MPPWVDAACSDYLRRLGAFTRSALIEIPAAARSVKQNAARAMSAEGQRLLAALEPGEFVAVLDERGREMSTRELATWTEARRRDGRDLAFVIGGADGLAPEVLSRADDRLALSRFTLPHALARVLLLEQLYRAHSLLAHHPYHRE